MQFLEIYKEEAFDLLDPNLDRTNKEQALAIREDPEAGTVYAAGAIDEPCGSFTEAIDVLKRGTLARATGGTAMNHSSSRSHAIFTVTVRRTNHAEDGAGSEAKLHFVDLAGSERQKKSGAEGSRLKEGIDINRGLLALGNVISVLGDPTKQGMHVPYRDSKITRMLQDSLGGNSRTVFVCCVSPADSNFDESSNSLKYANRAKNIRNTPTLNEDDGSAELKRLRRENQLLKQQLANSQGTGAAPAEIKAMREDKEQAECNAGLAALELAALKKQMSELTEGKSQLEQEFALFRLKAEKRLKVGKKSDAKAGEEGEGEEKEEEDIVMEKIRENETLRARVSELELERESALWMVSMPTGDEVEGAKEYATVTEVKKKEAQVANKERDYQAQQRSLKTRIAGIDQGIAEKHDLLSNIKKGQVQFESMQKKYQESIATLEEQCRQIKREKQQLQKKVDAPSTNKGKRLQEKLEKLETELGDMRRRKSESAKLLSLQKQQQGKIEELTKQIDDAATQKVRLAQQLKEESRTHREWNHKRTLELAKLRRAQQKTEWALKKAKTESEHSQAIASRRTEELQKVTKKLRDTQQLTAGRGRTSKRLMPVALTEAGPEAVSTWFAGEVEFCAEERRVRSQLRADLQLRRDLANSERAAGDAVDVRIQAASASIAEAQQWLCAHDMSRGGKMARLLASVSKAGSMDEVRALLTAAVQRSVKLQCETEKAEVELSKSRQTAAKAKLMLDELQHSAHNETTKTAKQYEENVAVLIEHLADSQDTTKTGAASMDAGVKKLSAQLNAMKVSQKATQQSRERETARAEQALEKLSAARGRIAELQKEKDNLLEGIMIAGETAIPLVNSTRSSLSDVVGTKKSTAKKAGWAQGTGDAIVHVQEELVSSSPVRKKVQATPVSADEPDEEGDEDKAATPIGRKMVRGFNSVRRGSLELISKTPARLARAAWGDGDDAKDGEGSDDTSPGTLSQTSSDGTADSADADFSEFAEIKTRFGEDAKSKEIHAKFQQARERNRAALAASEKQVVKPRRGGGKGPASRTTSQVNKVIDTLLGEDEAPHTAGEVNAVIENLLSDDDDGSPAPALKPKAARPGETMSINRIRADWSMTMDEIKNLCRKNNIKGYTGLKKRELIDLVNNHTAADVPQIKAVPVSMPPPSSSRERAASKSPEEAGVASQQRRNRQDSVIGKRSAAQKALQVLKETELNEKGDMRKTTDFGVRDWVEKQRKARGLSPEQEEEANNSAAIGSDAEWSIDSDIESDF